VASKSLAGLYIKVESSIVIDSSSIRYDCD